MASNFRVSATKKGKSLYLKLYGDFDGTSAFELIDMLKEKTGNKENIYIMPNGLRNVYQFGIDVFRSHLTFDLKRSVNIIMGNYGAINFREAENVIENDMERLVNA